MKSSAGGLIYVNAGDENQPYVKAKEGADVRIFNGNAFNTDAVDMTNVQNLVSGNYLSYYMDTVAGLSGSTAGKFVGVMLGTYSVSDIVG